MGVSVHVCIYLCIWVCGCVYIYLCMWVCSCVWGVWVCVYISMYMGECVCMNVWLANLAVGPCLLPCFESVFPLCPVGFLVFLGCFCLYFPPSCRHPGLQTSMLLLLVSFAWFLGIWTEVFVFAWHMLCLPLSPQHWDNFLVVELSRVGTIELYLFIFLPGGADMS